MKLSRARFTLLFLVLTFAGVGIAAWTLGRENVHLRALVSGDPQVGCQDDRITRGELEAAGDSAVPFLRKQLQRPPGPLEQLAAWLSSTGRLNWIRDWISESPADSLLDRLTERDVIKQQSIHALLLLGPDGIDARPELVALAEKSGDHLSYQARAALATLSPTDPATVSNYSAILTGNSQPGRYLLARDFPLVWPEPPAHLEILIARLQDADDTVRLITAKSLAHYGPAASNAIPSLLQILEDSNSRVRPSAAFALGRISPAHADRAIEILLGQQRTNTSWTGDLAYQLYAELGPAAARTVPQLRLDLARSLTNGFSAYPAYALWRVTQEASPEVVQGLARGCGQFIQRFQLAALQGLREVGPPASNAIPILQRLLESPLRTIQRSAGEALESITGNGDHPSP